MGDRGHHNLRYTSMNIPRINACELSSRKLWQLAETASSEEISAEEMAEVIAELAKRCHDLDQLRQIDQLKAVRQG
jgi:uncharacterized protein YaaN involved in tellurite resistance